MMGCHTQPHAHTQSMRHRHRRQLRCCGHYAIVEGDDDDGNDDVPKCRIEWAIYVCSLVAGLFPIAQARAPQT